LLQFALVERENTLRRVGTRKRVKYLTVYSKNIDNYKFGNDLSEFVVAGSQILSDARGSFVMLEKRVFEALTE